jgi:hypothetical protein
MHPHIDGGEDSASEWVSLRLGETTIRHQGGHHHLNRVSTKSVLVYIYREQTATGPKPAFSDTWPTSGLFSVSNSTLQSLPILSLGIVFPFLLHSVKVVRQLLLKPEIHASGFPRSISANSDGTVNLRRSRAIHRSIVKSVRTVSQPSSLRQIFPRSICSRRSKK